MKQFIVCHMMASIDGRIDCDMLEKYPGGNCYYDALDYYKCQAFVEGRVSRGKHAALPDGFRTSVNTPCGFRVHCGTVSKSYSVSLDTHGSLMWPGDMIDDRPLLCIVSEDAPSEYLDYLRTLGASYIAVGRGRIDLQRAMEILNSEFGIERFAGLPVYAVTADVEEQKSFAERGFTGVLLKPLTIDTLSKLFN